MRGVFLFDCRKELDEIFGETNIERNDEIIRWECFLFIYLFIHLFVYLIKQANIFGSFFSNNDDNDEFTLGDAVLFTWKKRKNRLEHAYAVSAWALSLLHEVRTDCMERLSTNNRDQRKLVGEVVSRLHYPPCPNKNVASKSIDELIDIFGKNLNILFTGLSLTAINQIILRTMMLSLVDLTSGMRFIPFHSLWYLVLFKVN